MSTRHQIDRDYKQMIEQGKQDLKDALQKEAMERYRRPPGECPYCDSCRDDNMMPSHTASDRCESGRHNHCTCDRCY
jgi:hypothetical protein